ncbi:MAG: alanine racemase [Kiloniellales bacterium]
MPSPSAILTIDLHAIQQNYRLLVSRAQGAEVGAAVKADAYGLGVGAVSQALWAAGARSFFVAQANEAVGLRSHLPNARIFVLNGALPGDIEDIKQAKAIPMVNSLEQLNLWRSAAEPGAPTALHLDTGMARLGLSPEEVAVLGQEPERLEGLEIALVATHPASSEELDSPQNRLQDRRFLEMASALPPAARQAPRSLANSSGILNDDLTNGVLVRPGYALYGGNPCPGQANIMQRVITLEAPILQIRRVPKGATVGYNALYVTKQPTRLATLAIGYAEGYDRKLSNRGRVSIAGRSANVVGRISMDLTIVDVGAIPQSLCQVGSLATLIGDDPSLEEVATAAGTIGYELLARLGNRLDRRYLGG